jgi:hypothetical protein
MQIRFHADAEAELIAARLWYGLQREGLDSALMERVNEALGRASWLRLTAIQSFIGSLEEPSYVSSLSLFSMSPLQTESLFLRCTTPGVIQRR